MVVHCTWYLHLIRRHDYSANSGHDHADMAQHTISTTALSATVPTKMWDGYIVWDTTPDIPLITPERIETCSELRASLHSCARIISGILPTTHEFYRVVARDSLSGRVVGMTWWGLSWRPGYRYEPQSLWTACESGACPHVPSNPHMPRHRGSPARA